MNLTGRLGIVEVVFLLILLRVIYIAASKGFLREACKVIGLLCASFFAFHFYSYLPEAIGSRFSFINIDYLYPVAFLSIFLGVVTVFSLLNLVIGLFLPKEEGKAKQQPALMILGALRVVVFASLIFFLFNLFSFKPGYIKGSFAYNLLKNVTPALYLFGARTIGSFNPDFEPNQQVEVYLEKDKPTQKSPVMI